MKQSAKHRKECKKTISFFKLHYSVKPPFSVVVDTSFLRACADLDLQPRHELLTELDDKMTPITTPAILEELRQAKEWSAHKHAKTFFLLKDGQEIRQSEEKAEGPQRRHTVFVACEPGADDLTDAALSVRRLIGNTNSGKYMVATNDKALRRILNRVPGVPLLHLDEDLRRVILTKPGPASVEHSQNVSRAKTTGELRAVDKSYIESLSAASAEKEPDVKRKRKVKGVNPMAAKKKKQKVDIR
ncbi:rRNA-processing protein utp23 [Diplonema papillatum]|nr:rRNA-processing protein utp23 [Diplonema papillatum]